MVVKQNNWIRTSKRDMIVHDPFCKKVIMVMMFLGLVSYFPAILAS